MNEKEEVEIKSKIGKFKISGKAKTIIIVVAIIATIFFCSMNYNPLLLFFLVILILIIGLSYITLQQYLYHKES